jgi:DNA-binding CsgD family transcriptional regulator/tetratricopeptide (TPR) repeat protein
VLVGRATELSVLDELLARSARGQATTVVVRGDAGVGKTRLLREFTASARAGGSNVVTGECPRLTGGLVPLAPVTAAVRALVAEIGQTKLRAAAGGAWPVLERHVPELSDDAPDLATATPPRPRPPIAPHRSYDLLTTLLERVATQAPLVVAMEDLHWADRSTLDFVSFAARRLRRARVLLVVTFRTHEVPLDHHIHAMVSELDRAGVERIDLEPLAEADLARLLEGIARGPLPLRLSDAIVTRSQGYPFYAEELLAAWDEGRDDVPLPASLRDVLLARTRLLPADTQRVLRLIATAGRRIDHATLAAVAATPDRALTALLRPAVDRHLVDHDGTTYGFRHSLVQEAVYGELLPGERIDLHRRFAETLEARGTLGELDAVLAAELAHHWDAADDSAATLRSSVEAGIAAERVFAFAEAHHQYERALRLWSSVGATEEVSPVDRLELQQRAADSAHLQGDAARAVTLMRSALADLNGMPRVGRRVPVLYERLGRYLWGTGDVRAAIEACEQARTLIPPEPTEERARVLAALARLELILTRYGAARRHSEEAIDAARSVGARREEGHALTTLGVVTAGTGEPDEGIAMLRQARRIAEEVDDADDLTRADYNLAAVLRGNGRLDDSAEVALAGARTVAAQGLGPTYGAFLSASAAEALVVHGRWADADRCLTTALAEPGLAMGARNLHQVTAMLRTGQGRFAEAHHHLDAALAAVGTRSSQPHGDLYPLLADLALWQGRIDEAKRWTAAARSSLEGSEDTTLLAQANVLALRAHADSPGEPDRAAVDALHRSLLSLPDYGERVPGTRAWLATAQAERGRALGASDPTRWESAVERWSELGWRYHAACARWREAEARLGRRGGRARGADVLRAAREEAMELGAIPLVKALSALAARFALDPGRDRTSDAGLTRRELDVLRLLAAGLTNRQIAADLVISEKTVGSHVAHIFDKLGVHTRTAAASEAHRLGVTSTMG